MAGTPTKAFRQRVKEKKAEDRPVIEFDLMLESDDEVDEDGNPIVLRTDRMHATMPSDERFFMLAAMAGDEDASGAEEAAATWGLLREVFPPEEFRILKTRLLDQSDPFSLEEVQELLMWLVEEWSGFPTQLSSESSPQSPPSGGNSTGRVRGPGSTRSNSR